MSKDNYSEDDVVKSPWVKWGKVGDNIHGTLISINQKEQVNQYTGKQETVLIYEIKADGGEYHDIDEKKNPIEPEIKIEQGQVYNVGDHFTIHGVMKNIKLGQKIKIEFFEEKPSKTKGNAPMKVRRVLSKGEMDTEWLKEKEEEANLNDF